MEISKSGWVYKVAYSGLAPASTNLCAFFWKFMVMLFLGWPLIGVFFVIYYLVITVGFVGGFFIAFRPAVFDEDDFKTRNLMINYEKWPSVKGYRLLPIYFVVPALLTWFLPEIWAFLILPPTMFAVSAIGLAIFSGVVLIWMANGGLLKKLSRSSETYQLVKDYLVARKQKVCPIVRFKD